MYLKKQGVDRQKKRTEYEVIDDKEDAQWWGFFWF